MPRPVSILAFAGSTRTNSFNGQLLEIAADGARAQGAEVTLIKLRDYPMPFYDADLERQEGIPKNALALKKLFAGHEGLLIAVPEYNASVSAVLKNLIDWVSRAGSDEDRLGASFEGKVAALLSASPGPLGGARAQIHLSQILGALNVVTLPRQTRLPSASDKLFNSSGGLEKAETQAAIRNVGATLASFLERMAT